MRIDAQCAAVVCSRADAGVPSADALPSGLPGDQLRLRVESAAVGAHHFHGAVCAGDARSADAVRWAAGS